MTPPDPGPTAPQRQLPLEAQAFMVIATTGLVGPLIAREAGARGARVALASNDAPQDGGLNGLMRFTSPLDSEAEIDRLYDAALERLAGLDVVIVALEAQTLETLHTVPLEQWRTRVAEPLRQAFWLARRALDEFIGSGHGGRLLFVIDRPDAIGEGAGILGEAVASLARSLAREYGRQRVSCQVVVQAGSAAQSPDERNSHRPLVDCVLFLASAAASFVNGEIVMVGSPVNAAPTSPTPR